VVPFFHQKNKISANLLPSFLILVHVKSSHTFTKVFLAGWHTTTIIFRGITPSLGQAVSLYCNFLFVEHFWMLFSIKHSCSYTINGPMFWFIPYGSVYLEVKVETCIFLNHLVPYIAAGTRTHLAAGECLLALFSATVTANVNVACSLGLQVLLDTYRAIHTYLIPCINATIQFSLSCATTALRNHLTSLSSNFWWR
jgi:hypothetical protein